MDEDDNCKFRLERVKLIFSEDENNIVLHIHKKKDFPNLQQDFSGFYKIS